MTLAMGQTKTALAPNLSASFLAAGGTGPYVYTVRAGGAGGTIDSSSGIYTAPNVVNGGSYGPPTQIYDVIQARDTLGNIGTSPILVGDALLLFCEIIQNQMNLPQGRVYLWDQKIMQPTDSGLYVAVAVLNCKPFGNTTKIDPTTGNSIQSVNMLAMLQVDIISRDTEARDRKEEALMALNSTYAEFQQEANSFLIGRLPPMGQFVNLSNPDGAAIPYRFNIGVNLQYFYTKTVASDYYDTFQTPPFTVITNP